MTTLFSAVLSRDSAGLRIAGEALYGPRWQRELARALAVTDRTVQRWVADEIDVPESRWGQIGRLCRERGLSLVRLAEEFHG